MGRHTGVRISEKNPPTQHQPPPQPHNNHTPKNNHTHRDVYGSKEVPEDFTVPFEGGAAAVGAGRWPERMQGLRLGKYFKKLVTEAVCAPFVWLGFVRSAV